MKIYHLFAIVPVIIWVSNTYAQVASVASTWKTYNENGVHIEYPGNWEFNDGEVAGTKFIIMSPAESESDDFQENVNLLVQDISSYNLDLEGYGELTKTQIETLLEDGKVFEYAKKEAKGNEFLEIGYMAKFQGAPLKWKQYLWVQDGNAYVLTFTAKQETYDEYNSDATQILDSFKFE